MRLGVSGVGMTSQRTRTRMIERLRVDGIRNERVLAALAAVPRHVFVEEALASRAYEDTALPLGFSQTISQPFIVARMIEVLREGRELGKTLEVGAGYLLAHPESTPDRRRTAEITGRLDLTTKLVFFIQDLKVTVRNELHQDGNSQSPPAGVRPGAGTAIPPPRAIAFCHQAPVAAKAPEVSPALQRQR